MNSQPDEILIIGYGNGLRGDDGAGPLAARELRRRGLAARDVHQLTPELAEALSRVALAVFIDAGADLAPGQVRAVTVAEGDRAPVDHHATPGGLLRLSREVYGRAPHAVLITIGGASYECGSRLSSAARRAVGQVVKQCVEAAAFSSAMSGATIRLKESILRCWLSTARGSGSRVRISGS